MTAITASAKGESCAVRLPFVCNHDNSTVVFAHINGLRFGHGMGIKTSLGAYCCFECHQAIDGRDYLHIDRNILKLAHYEGVIETLIKLKAKGLVKW